MERHKASSAVSGRHMNGHQGAAHSVAEPLPFNATVEPLLVHVGSQCRPPTLQESQIIMKHLQRIGEKQAHEVRSTLTLLSLSKSIMSKIIFNIGSLFIFMDHFIICNVLPLSFVDFTSANDVAHAAYC